MFQVCDLVTTSYFVVYYFIIAIYRQNCSLNVSLYILVLYVSQSLLLYTKSILSLLLPLSFQIPIRNHAKAILSFKFHQSI